MSPVYILRRPNQHQKGQLWRGCVYVWGLLAEIGDVSSEGRVIGGDWNFDVWGFECPFPMLNFPIFFFLYEFSFIFQFLLVTMKKIIAQFDSVIFQEYNLLRIWGVYNKILIIQ